MNPQIQGEQHPYDAISGGDYLIPIETHQDQHPHHDITLPGQTHGPDADDYVSLNPQTQGEQHPYDAISGGDYLILIETHQDQHHPHYDVTPRGQTQPSPAANYYNTVNPQTQGEQHQYDVISGGDYVILNHTHQDQPQYDVIQLGHIQHGPDADQYASLNPETQGQQPHYDSISGVVHDARQDTDAAEYVEMD